ncbi:MAG: carbon-nitrogen family hydrolase [Leptospiraceae bacterium]|nr:carbon-nitrogen family hydrolase [Leptospiraceae bacterium]MCK6381157.1 carbon-nitrogen family hydrolase [Leptospiraceae bacterium]NUM42499.1 carbon-nitrogen family hydrolase [Leptospiraceae bacterium]
MKIAAFQTDIFWQDPHQNLANYRKKIHSLQSPVDLVVFPETCSTGFTMKSKEFSEKQSGDTESFFMESATKLGSFVGGGWIEKNPKGLPFNTFSVASPEGKIISRYRKLHPFSFAGENNSFTSGSELTTLKIFDFHVALFICYDLRFPEVFRKTAGKTDLYIVIANWPKDRIEAWDTLLKARAIENQAYILGVNRVGDAGIRNTVSHNGHSHLIDPSGKNLFQFSEKEEFYLSEIQLEALTVYREKFPFLKDRKLEFN